MGERTLCGEPLTCTSLSMAACDLTPLEGGFWSDARYPTSLYRKHLRFSQENPRERPESRDGVPLYSTGPEHRTLLPPLNPSAAVLHYVLLSHRGHSKRIYFTPQIKLPSLLLAFAHWVLMRGTVCLSVRLPGYKHSSPAGALQ